MIDVLIVDDNNDKIAKIIKVVRDQSEKIFVDIVVDFVTAQEYLRNRKYDLLILDMNLPVRVGEETNVEIGKNLLNEINRRNELFSPKYIICLTQYFEECKEVSDIWRTVQYNPSSNSWKSTMNNLIKHILKSRNSTETGKLIKPTIFFEGKTDEKIFDEALKLFNPDLIDKIELKSEKSAGASWVARQVIAWAYSLNKDDGNNYVKAVGLIDGDIAGQNAISEINRVIKAHSAESNTFKIFKLSATYARHLIPIKQRGLDIPVCLEEMFPEECWDYANSKGWLRLRNKPENFLTEPKNWNGFEITLKDYLLQLGLSVQESLYLNTVNEDKKESFVKYILSQEEPRKKAVLNSFEKLIKDVSNFLLD